MLEAYWRLWRRRFVRSCLNRCNKTEYRYPCEIVVRSNDHLLKHGIRLLELHYIPFIVVDTYGTIVTQTYVKHGFTVSIGGLRLDGKQFLTSCKYYVDDIPTMLQLATDEAIAIVNEVPHVTNPGTNYRDPFFNGEPSD